jgi:2,4-dienoyl-CoA reductase (NADPH2)
VYDELGFHQAKSVAELLAARGLRGGDRDAGHDLGLTLDMERFRRLAHGAGIVMSPDRTVLAAARAAPGVRLTVLHHTVGSVSEAAYDWVVCTVPAMPENELWTALRDRGPAVHRIGDGLAPRGAHAAVIDGHHAGVAL